VISRWLFDVARAVLRKMVVRDLLIHAACRDRISSSRVVVGGWRVELPASSPVSVTARVARSATAAGSTPLVTGRPVL